MRGVLNKLLLHSYNIFDLRNGHSQNTDFLLRIERFFVLRTKKRSIREILNPLWSNICVQRLSRDLKAIMTMHITHATNDTCGDATGAVIAIDVLRAFTTAAFAFAAGARDILLVSTVGEALALRERFPGSFVMG